MKKRDCERLEMNTLTAAATATKNPAHTHTLAHLNASLNYSDRNVMKTKYRLLSTLDIKMEHPVH